eukprot:3279521-Amphidinium_carterae.1
MRVRRNKCRLALMSLNAQSPTDSTQVTSAMFGYRTHKPLKGHASILSTAEAIDKLFQQLVLIFVLYIAFNDITACFMLVVL